MPNRTAFLFVVALGALFLSAPSEAAEKDHEPIAEVDESKQEVAKESKQAPKKRNRTRRAPRGPDIVLVEAKDKTIYAYSQNGRLRAIKVVPTVGKPYYLRPADPTKHFGDIDRADLLLTTWVLVRF